MEWISLLINHKYDRKSIYRLRVVRDSFNQEDTYNGTAVLLGVSLEYEVS